MHHADGFAGFYVLQGHNHHPFLMLVKANIYSAAAFCFLVQAMKERFKNTYKRNMHFGSPCRLQ
jgi:hypothetical protein